MSIVGGKIVEDADPESYEKLNAYFYKDKNSIYYRGIKVDEILDPDSFEVIDTSNTYDNFGIDKFQTYCVNSNSERVLYVKTMPLDTSKYELRKYMYANDPPDWCVK